jgi:hypothetical protein
MKLKIKFNKKTKKQFELTCRTWIMRPRLPHRKQIEKNYKN